MDEITGHVDATEPDHHADRSDHHEPYEGPPPHGRRDGRAQQTRAPYAEPESATAAVRDAAVTGRGESRPAPGTGGPVTPPAGEPLAAPGAFVPAVRPVALPHVRGAGDAVPATPPAVPVAPAVTASPASPVPPGSMAPAASPPPPVPGRPPAPGLAALLRLAVLCVDPDGRISYWNRGAEELFGHRWEHVFGHRATGLLSTTSPSAGRTGTRAAASHHDTLELLDDLTVSSWAGALAATDRDGTLKDVLWWTYRLVEPTGRSLLAIATHAKPLRTGGLRIALGGRLLPYSAEGPQRQDIAVAAVLMPSADPSAGQALAGRLADVLPGASPGRLDRIVRQVGALGHPALEVEDGARLPVVPHERARLAAAARAETAVRRELLSSSLGGGRGSAGAARGDGTGQAADLSSASALTAVPLPSLTSPPVSTVTPSQAGGPATGSAGTAAGVQGAPGPAAPSPYRPGEPPDHPVAGTPRADLGHEIWIGSDTGFPGSDVPRQVGNALDEQLALLRAAGSIVGSTLDLHTTARELCSVTVPRFADLATVLVVDQLFSDAEPPKDDRPSDTVLVRRVASALPGLSGGWDAALPEGELLALTAGGVPTRLGEPVLVPVVDPALAPDIAVDLGVPLLAPLLAGHSLIVAPLTARGTVLGQVCFLRGPGRRPFDVRDAATAAEVVARGAVHIDNARLHRQESRAAATLQRSMMPTRPPRIPGVRIAHHYMPGDRQAQVGGDWFDAIQLPGGRVALIVGDVMGHGLQAAAVMGQFRTSVITMAALDLPPAQLLRHLDNLAHRLGTEHLATCVYAVYDPIHRTLTLANAGHIPPVLAGSDGRGELLRIPGGAPIGVGGVPFETVEVPAPDGSWLVLCTDGLVEVRGQGIDAGLAALCANVIEPQQTPEDVCAQILARVHSEDRRDDVALLVARFEGVAPQDVIRWTLLIDYAEVARARELTRRQLAAWGLEHLSDVAELLVSELVTNAIKAASYEVELRLMRVGKLLVEVSDDNHNLPQLQRAEADDVCGRGLALVSHLSRRWGTSRKAVGKVVWFELPIPS
ncbi:Serine phosphatase RsbU, regulator of sigma subunit [Actinacidiphila yanglinensis]|uniref:protein-serine/threonine phosphatase n=1 Tax=Actinacidiphila yanglinensis TaxID=310779 RepID=A0A1H6A4F4_9ACTN|nr:SpoIIE family protein phosphatase [Actinacidiphila yanglinensis]SEG43230.1 Serine phosphatase RsbU, regulator of sigma subunit [Actinacidiphila yanglinensis]